ncbi:MAG TPA: hypothetical protein VFJ58_29080 [Armatimonadota bacterium]|nr:hypothetical protein [Armatimonadota bacterium]
MTRFSPLSARPSKHWKRRGLLPQELAPVLADLVDFRNTLAHAYLRVTPALVEMRVPVLLASARAFADAVARWRSPGETHPN